MKATLVLFLTFISISAMAQTEKESYKKASSEFQKNYNAHDFTAIFNQFSPEMQSALPVEKAKDFFESLNQNLGKIKEINFKKYQYSYALYKATFERGTMAVKMSVDDHLKINGMLVEQYTEQDFADTGKK